MNDAIPTNVGSDEAIVAALDTKYQAAVKANDAQTMAEILHDEFVIVLGDGKVYKRIDLLNLARSGMCRWEQQDEEEGTQSVRVWGDTAVVTAKLWLKGTMFNQPRDEWLWFSDTYVRTREGWRYVFGQASLPLPTG